MDIHASTLFVLDTNVLLHDPNALTCFAEHDLYIPIITLEELDHQKKGSFELARHARQVSRMLDRMTQDMTHTNQLKQGLPLNLLQAHVAGRLFLQDQHIDEHLPPALSLDKSDNHILNVLCYLSKIRSWTRVILVSKDINIRIKARILGLEAQDYRNDYSIEDQEILGCSMNYLSDDFWEKSNIEVSYQQKDGFHFYSIMHHPDTTDWVLNSLVMQGGENPIFAQVVEKTSS